MSKIEFEPFVSSSRTDSVASKDDAELQSGNALRDCAFGFSDARCAENARSGSIRQTGDVVAPSKPTDKDRELQTVTAGADGNARPKDRPTQMKDWVKDLASNDYRTREHATRQLSAAGAEALPYLKDLLTKDDQDLEACRRARGLVDQRISLFPSITAKQWIDQVTAPSDKRMSPFDITDPPETMNISLIPEALRKSRAEEAKTIHDILSHSTIWDEGYSKRFGQLKDEYKTQCPDAEKVKILGLGQSQITDKGIERLKACKNLEELYLFDTKINDKSLAHIASFSHLKNLHLDCTNISDEGLKSISGLKLQMLSVFGCRGVGDDGMKEIGKINSLDHLMVNSTGITDKGVEHLKGLTKLQMLALENTAVTDDAMKHLKGMKDLRFLQLNMTDIGDAGMKELAGLTKLQTLLLPGGITDASLDHIKGMTDLQDLSFDDCKVTDAGLAKLKNLPRLVELYIFKTPGITDKGLTHIQALPNLKSVQFQEAQVTKKGLDALATVRPNLRISAMANINGVLRDIR